MAKHWKNLSLNKKLSRCKKIFSVWLLIASSVYPLVATHEDLETSSAINTSNPYIERLKEIVKERPIRILSIDGGGIRGVIPLQWLIEFENEIKKSAFDIFDVFVGTSTGGIIAAGLASGKTAQDILEIYSTEKENMFDHRYDSPFVKNFLGEEKNKTYRAIRGVFGTNYDSEKVKKVLERKFKDKTQEMLSQLKKPVFITTLKILDAQKVNGESAGYELVLLDSIQEKSSENKIRVIDALRATSAAPYFFDPVTLNYQGEKHEFVDGGMVCNSPAKEGFYRLKKHLQENGLSTEALQDKMKILSLGTGIYGGKYESKKSISFRDFLRITGIDFNPFFVKDLGFTIMNAQCRAQAHDVHMDLCIMLNTPQEKNYFRVNFEGLTENSEKMDNVDKLNFTNLKNIAMETKNKARNSGDVNSFKAFARL